MDMAAAQRSVNSEAADTAVDWHGILLRITRYQASRYMADHSHPTSCISLVVRGGFLEESGAGTYCAGVGDWAIKPAGVRHADQFGAPETTILQLRLSERMPPLLADASFRLQGYRCGGAGRLTSVLFELFTAMSLPTKNGVAPAVDDLLIDVLGLAASESRRLSCTPPAWLARVDREIRRLLPNQVRVADLAAAVGVNPVHMARVFQRIHGCGVVAYIRRLRVQFAASQLSRGGKTLCETALAAGFCDQPHLNRAFRRRLGLSPAGYRQLLGSAAHPN